jgi:phenylalanyl-tRNA synthetase beta chain
MGGIFGGEHSGVNDETQNVLLECAFFSPLSITGRARRHGLHTDASHRYERGVDSALQYKAMERATRLLIDICGGEAGRLSMRPTKLRCRRRRPLPCVVANWIV